MFHQGTLQDGIGKAVQESKSVLCFVTDGGPESSTWENEWLQDESIPSTIEQQAIALRLEAGSQEAGFLAAFCPISEIPTIVVIYNGQLLEQLDNGITKTDFTHRLLQSINRTNANPASAAPSSVPQQNIQSSQASSSQSSPAQPTAPKPKKPSSQPNSPSNQQSDQDTNSSARARRPNEISYAQEQTQRKREAKLERERILRIIENDKVERREREEQRRRTAQALAEEEAQGDAVPQSDEAESHQNPFSAAAQSSAPSGSAHVSTRIQIRLTDGDILRNAFPSSTTLAAVRKWVDSQRTDDPTPYTLKQILTPHPSRALSDAEERESLGELGLAPSAVLVMVPAKGAVRAYASRVAPGVGGGAAAGVLDAGQGILSNLWAWIMAVVMRIIAAVRTFLGLDMPVQPATAGDRRPVQGRTAGAAAEAGTGKGKEKESAATGYAPASAAGPGPGIRIRTLRDQRSDGDRDKQQELYNGNQLNFEPNEGNDDENT